MSYRRKCLSRTRIRCAPAIVALDDPRQHARQRRAHAGRERPPSMQSRPRVAAHLVSLVHGTVCNKLVWRPRRQKNTFRSRLCGRSTREAIARQRPVGAGTNYSERKIHCHIRFGCGRYFCICCQSDPVWNWQLSPVFCKNAVDDSLRYRLL